MINDLELSEYKKDLYYFIYNHCLQYHNNIDSYIPLQYIALDKIRQNKLSIIKHKRQIGITSLLIAYSIWICKFHKNQKIQFATNSSQSIKHVKRIYLQNLFSFKNDYYDGGFYYEFENGSKIEIVNAHDQLINYDSKLTLLIIDNAEFIYNDVIFDNLVNYENNNKTSVILASSHERSNGGNFMRKIDDAVFKKNSYVPLVLM